MKKLTLLIIAILYTVIATAQTFTDTEITYEVIPGTTTVTITKETTASGDVTIPSTVTDTNGIVYTVTVIGANTFDNNQLTSVTIPDSVTTIGDSAFAGNQLTSVTIPGSVIEIGNFAFNNSGVTSVTLGTGIITIGQSAFSQNQLTSVTIPESVTTIGVGAFENNDLTSVTFLGNSLTTIRENAFFLNDLTSITLPNSVTTIGKDAFSRNDLTSVTISNSITTIETGAFRDNQLTTVTIPNSVTTIGNAAFENNQLTTVTLPNSVTTIGNIAFENNQLTTVTIPNSVTTIGNSAFASQKNQSGQQTLTQVTAQGTDPPTITTGGGLDTFGEDSRGAITLSVPKGRVDIYKDKDNGWGDDFANIVEISSFTIAGITYQINDPDTNTATIIDNTNTGEVNIPENVTNPNDNIQYTVTEIDADAFSEDQLTKVTFLGNSITSIGAGAFFNNNLSTVTLPNGVITIGVGAFQENKLTSITIPNSVITIGVFAFGGNQLEQLEIPNSVKTIGESAFNNNQLTSVTIPNSVTTIDQLAFGNNALTQVTAQGTNPPSITGTGVLDPFGDRSEIDLFVPLGTEQAYKQAGWEGFKSTTEIAIQPVITLEGDNPQLIELGADYTDPGATAVDSNGVDITGDIKTDNPVDTAVPDTYTVIYTVTDAANNTATLTRTVIVQDTTPPGIALIGDQEITIELGGDYTELGATVTDLSAGDIEPIIDSSAIDTSTLGTYTVTYNATDASGNKAIQVDRTVIVADITPPVITLLGDNLIRIELNTTFTDPGATALDNVDGDITDKIDTDNPVNTSLLGTYTITYTVSDAADNTATLSRTVEVVQETTPPVITLLGDPQITIELGDTTFTDPGATALDNNDGDITDKIITTNPVDIAVAATYTITYTVTDAAGNKADPVNRTVNVVDTTPPVITLNGDNPQTIPLDGNYTELGATVTDLSAGDIEPIIDSSAINTSVAGSYTVTYNATDAAGNTAVQVDRTVIVADTTPPVITLLGDNPQRIELGDTFTDPGATALDNNDGDLTNSLTIDSSAVDTSVLGDYLVTYTVTDAAGNTATLTRTVQVVQEATAPVITVLGDQQITLELGDTFTDPGATAIDNSGVDITNDIITNNPVDTAIADTYTITYNVTDASGNTAVQVIRTVIIQDTTPPVITLNGDNPQRIQIDADYIELGATVTDLSGGDIDPVIDSSAVDTSVLGDYTVTYNATDASGNLAIQVTRTVIVTECPIANDNFTLQSLAETCSGKNNGAIRINAKTELDYTLTINEQQLPFTSELLIADLAPATYPICITVDGFSNCQQCFEVVINPGINIAGTTAIQQQAFGNTKLQVAIQTGTPPYTVYVNGLQKTVSQNKNFSISVANGDQVEVSSALECQGKLTTKVQLEDELQLYPNPTQGDVTLTLGTTALKNIAVVIYNPLGIAVSKAKLSVANRQVIIPMSTLPKGAYILQLPEIGRTFKVIKN